jgi:uroporphyrinogen III methyltransferase / synthase
MILDGKRILITRPRARSREFAAALTLEGAVPIVFPVMEIIPLQDYSDLDRALRNLKQYDWLVLTSVHGVEAFISRLSALKISALPPQVRVAAVGRKTRLSLARNNIETRYVPSQFSATAIAEGMERLTGKKILLLQSDLAGLELKILLESKGARVDALSAYRNIPAASSAADIEVLHSGLDVITFTSPSAVKGLMRTAREHAVDISRLPGMPLFACIGPITARTMLDAGLSVQVEAAEHTIEGMILALKKYK